MGARLSLLFKISLPLLFLVMVEAYPLSHAVVENLREAREAETQGKPQERAEALHRVLMYEPWRVMLWEQAGRADLEAGRVTEAIDAFKQASQAGTLSVDGHILLGDAYLQNGEAQAAEGVWQELITPPGSTDPEFTDPESPF